MPPSNHTDAGPHGTGVALGISWATASHLGRRSENQDRVFADGRLVVVLDGVGGVEFGGQAASTALAEAIRVTALQQAQGAYDLDVVLRSMNDAVLALSQATGWQTATTAVLAIPEFTDQGPILHVGWTGDSGAILVRGSQLSDITGRGSGGGRRLEEWLGNPDGYGRNQVTLPLQRGDRFLAFTDGLTSACSLDEIGAQIASAGSADAAVRAVLGAAHKRGISDNTTLGCVFFSEQHSADAEILMAPEVDSEGLDEHNQMVLQEHR